MLFLCFREVILQCAANAVFTGGHARALSASHPVDWRVIIPIAVPVLQSYRFGIFEFNGKSGELWKDGRLIKLQPQPARLLELLVNHAGRVVARNEIQQAIWGADIQVDYELGVNRCIRQIRGALLDNADAPLYIQTVARKGYRFIAPVERLARETVNGHVPGSAVEPAPENAPSPEPPLDRLRVLRHNWLSLCIFVIAVIALTVWLQYTNRFHLPSNLEVVPLVSQLGYEYAPTFSPDGRQVAFTWNGERQDNFDIYVKPTESTRLLRLTTDSATDYSPVWSPDGHWIAFCRGTDSPGGGLWIVPALGGAERKIADLHTIADPTNRSISWSPDGKSLVLASALRAGRTHGLELVNVATGKVKQLTFPAAEEDDSYPAVSPQGGSIAFTRDTGKGFSAVYLLPFRPESAEPLKPERLNWPGFQDLAYGHTAWTPRDGRLVFESNRGGPHRLWIAPARQNAQAAVLASLGENLSGATVSSTGRLAFVRSPGNSNIWRIDVKSFSAGQAAAATRIVASTRDDESPAVSPDGQRLAFASDRSGFKEVWVSKIDGSDPVQVTFLRHLAGSPSWSPDGQQLLFDSREKGDARLYSVTASGGGEPVKLLFGPGVLPVASPDGKWIYFSSRLSGSMQIWRISQEGGAAQQVTELGGFGAKLSPDGRFAYYTRNNTATSSLWQVDLSNRNEKAIAGSVYIRAFVPANDAVYYFSGGPYGAHSLTRFILESGTNKCRFTAGKVDGRGIALSPDGRFLFYGELDHSNSELMLVENFWK